MAHNLPELVTGEKAQNDPSRMTCKANRPQKAAGVAMVPHRVRGNMEDKTRGARGGEVSGSVDGATPFWHIHQLACAVPRRDAAQSGWQQA